MSTSINTPATQRSSHDFQLLTIQQVAGRLGVSLQRAYEMARTGILPVVHLGRQLRVEEKRLAAWIGNGGRALPGGWKRNPD
jgi:excisionase family DNA binding protein